VLAGDVVMISLAAGQMQNFGSLRYTMLSGCSRRREQSGGRGHAERCSKDHGLNSCGVREWWEVVSAFWLKTCKWIIRILAGHCWLRTMAMRCHWGGYPSMLIAPSYLWCSIYRTAAFVSTPAFSHPGFS
jgi:hypothetical protein